MVKVAVVNVKVVAPFPNPGALIPCIKKLFKRGFRLVRASVEWLISASDPLIRIGHTRIKPVVRLINCFGNEATVKPSHKIRKVHQNSNNLRL